jgi:hypothetical protein
VSEFLQYDHPMHYRKAALFSDVELGIRAFAKLQVLDCLTSSEN